MSEELPTKDDLIKSACIYYKKFFKNDLPTHGASAPGRVSLLGEHTDYNEGLVFLMGAPMFTIVVGAANNSTNVSVYTMAEGLNESNHTVFKIPQEEKLTPGMPSWGNYCRGAIANFKEKIPGFNAVINSSVPIGAGASSSASFTVAFYTFLEAITGKTTDLKEKAKSCVKVEHDFVNVPCGIMGQYTAVFAQEHMLLLLDCKTWKVQQVAYDDPSVTIVLTDSNVRHSLSGSEYPARRKQCHDAANEMKLQALRQSNPKKLEEYQTSMNPIVYRRARHVLSEISRTLEGTQAVIDKDYKALGHLLAMSHFSLKYDFEVSCKELDTLVDIAMKTQGVYGSKMTGAGFGGSTMTLVETDAVPDYIAKVKERYKGRTTFYIATPSSGAMNESDKVQGIARALH